MARRRISDPSPGDRPCSVGLISLGCSKNLVDLQVMAGELLHEGITLAPSAEAADIILVNTCAFIEDAREEAAAEILWACERKKAGFCRAVLVTGCLPQRYRGRMLRAFPDVDAVLGVDDLDRVAAVVRSLAAGGHGIEAVADGAPRRLFAPRRPDLVLTGGPFAYLKVAEGCNHGCAFCAIPGIRGRQRSRPVADLVREAETLLSSGIRELNLIAQDVAAYGRETQDGPDLVTLLHALDRLGGTFWIRLLYGYPSGVTEALLEWMAGSPHACRYLDLPLQHSHPDVLRAMRRADTIDRIEGLTGQLRAAVPGVTLRTTFLVGFPGETEDHFRHLQQYVAREAFDHVGVFAYSPEAGTPAMALEGEPDDIVAERRRDQLMRQQAKAVAERLARQRGAEDTVLLEQPYLDEGGGATPWWSARSQAQAPEELDGVTLVEQVPQDAVSGSFVRVRYTGQADYDLQARYLGPAQDGVRSCGTNC